MTDKEKVVKGLECCMSEQICKGCPYKEKDECEDGGYYYSKAIEDAIALLKEQDEMISITTVAEFLADGATPPPTAERWERVMLWEQFLLDLKGRKTGNDKSRSHSDFE